ncbi:YraN family protein [Sandarakinorhabdus oryzae]|uniref:YraN family protein n=1 Tax=Sandarakinorhabdus oryzae TaxID=2675220 RepID=UPI0012E2AB77|nr:YraN family protein [Sandarakinorhabdus oryzae]
MADAKDFRRRQANERRGRMAEHVAAIWLIAKGYRLLGRRLKTPGGEIDLLLRHRDALVFVEVKARPTLDSGLAALHLRQQRRCQAAARWLATRHGWPGAVLRHDAVVIMPWAWPRHLVAIWREEA